MSYQLKVLRDYPMAFWPLDETSGSTAYDISGCENHGDYVGTFQHGLPPLVPGGNEGTLIESNYDPLNAQSLNQIVLPTSKDYYSNADRESFGTYATSDNDFTIEFWIKPIFDSSYNINEITFITDNGIANDPRLLISLSGAYIKCGVREENSSEYWSWQEVIGYTNFVNKSIHVVFVYSVNNISIYIDGALSGTKELPANFKFFKGLDPNSSNNPIELTVRTYMNSFLIDAIAIYRYSLPYKSIISHYTAGNNQINPHQVANINSGKIFDLNATKFYETFIYTYPADKNLKSFINSTNIDYIYYDEGKKCLKFYNTLQSSNTVYLEDFILIPENIGTNSKIEWRGDRYINVQVSNDGVNYQDCVNGGVVPFYNSANFNYTGKLYIKVIMDSSYDGLFLNGGEFSFLSIVFYRDQTLHSDNGGGKLEIDDQIPSAPTFGTLNYPTLSRHVNNGIRPNGGFKINSFESNINTIEMFVTLDSIVESQLFYWSNGPSSAGIYWDSNGSLSKLNIKYFYVNGVNKTSESNITNIFVPGQMYHVIIVPLLEMSIGSNIYFNYNPNSLIFTQNTLYNNIILYENELTTSQITDNYDLWIGKPNNIIVDPPITIDEKAIKVDDVDWVVVSSS